LSAASHPYSQILLHSAQGLSDRTSIVQTSNYSRLKKTNNADRGCGFAPSCPLTEEICFRQMPDLAAAGDGHHVACHFAKGADSKNTVTIVCEGQPGSVTAKESRRAG
ncbi:MAG TPA: oligopeptide/dipeptide ABC transporter ATP-binding protein, partial [bacterium]